MLVAQVVLHIFENKLYSQTGFPFLMHKPWSLPSLLQVFSNYILMYSIHLPLRSDPKNVVLQKYLLPNQTCPNQTAQLTWQQTLLDPQSRELENTLDSQVLLKPVQVPTNAKESFFIPRQVKSSLSSSFSVLIVGIVDVFCLFKHSAKDSSGRQKDVTREGPKHVTITSKNIINLGVQLLTISSISVRFLCTGYIISITPLSGRCGWARLTGITNWFGSANQRRKQS